MKGKLYELLNFLPIFAVISSQSEGAVKLKVVFVELLRSLIVPIVAAVVSVFVTIQVMKAEVTHMAVAADKLEKQVMELCKEIGQWRMETERRLSIVETRQIERLERERAQGIRRPVQ